MRKDYGCKRMKATIYGGACSENRKLIDPKFGVKNCEFARSLLKDDKIELIKESTGGDRGRSITASISKGKKEIANALLYK